MNTQHAAIIQVLTKAGFRSEFIRAQEVRLARSMMGTVVGWSNDPRWGTSWWYEDGSRAELTTMAATEWRWENQGKAPFEYVSADEIGLMDRHEFFGLHAAWVANRGTGSVSDEVDAIMVAEAARRGITA
jgi:hypothetical protein